MAPVRFRAAYAAADMPIMLDALLLIRHGYASLFVTLPCARVTRYSALLSYARCCRRCFRLCRLRYTLHIRRHDAFSLRDDAFAAMALTRFFAATPYM